MYRVLKDESFCISFYGWQKTYLFMAAWRAAGLRIVGHIVFRKSYASSVRFMRYQHEQAYLLAKGDAVPPRDPLSDVMEFPYSQNRLHPTQKPTQALEPLIRAFCKPDGIVLDPLCYQQHNGLRHRRPILRIGFYTRRSPKCWAPLHRHRA